jgi:hypothetical protein
MQITDRTHGDRCNLNLGHGIGASGKQKRVGVTGEQEDAGATWRGGEGEEDKVVEWRSDGGDME